MRSLKQVMRNKNVPPDILQTLLNLAEFMDHEVEVGACGREEVQQYIQPFRWRHVTFDEKRYTKSRQPPYTVEARI